MPIFKTNKTTYVTHAIYEDIRPTGNRLYIWGEAHNRDDLGYQISDGLNHSTTKTGMGGRGYPSMAYTDHRYDGVLFLAGETVHVQTLSTTNNDDRNNLQVNAFLSMDETNPVRNHRYVQYGTDNVLINIYQHMWQNNVTGSVLWETFYNVGNQRLDLAPIAQQGTDNYRFLYMFDIKEVTQYVQCITMFSATPRLAWPGSWGPGRISGFFGTSGFTYTGPTAYTDQWIQRIGTARNGGGLYLLNLTANDYSQTVIRYDDVSNTITTLQTINNIPNWPQPPGANNTSTGWLLPGTTTTNVGGIRGGATTTNIRISSKTFIDPTTSTGRAWYTPYFDTGTTYQPFFYQWNTVTDLFSRSSDVIVDWRGTGTQWAATATQWIYFQPDNISGAAQGNTYGMQRPWYNETFTVASGTTTTRYLTLFQFHGSGNQFDSNPLFRTFVTFQIDQVNPKQMVRHSQVTVPWTPKNIIWLADDRTLMGIFGQNFFNMYAFSTATGWTQTVSLPYRFEAVGRDGLGRIWAIDPGPFNYGRLHLITPALPATVSVTMAQATYNFTGTTITTTATVNCFDSYGNRIASRVDLSIDGTSMRFIQPGTTTTQVTTVTTTTSVLGDTNLGVVILSAGFSYINAALTV